MRLHGYLPFTAHTHGYCVPRAFTYILPGSHSAHTYRATVACLPVAVHGCGLGLTLYRLRLLRWLPHAFTFTRLYILYRHAVTRLRCVLDTHRSTHCHRTVCYVCGYTPSRTPAHAGLLDTHTPHGWLYHYALPCGYMPVTATRTHYGSPTLVLTRVCLRFTHTLPFRLRLCLLRLCTATAPPLHHTPFAYCHHHGLPIPLRGCIRFCVATTVAHVAHGALPHVARSLRTARSLPLRCAAFTYRLRFARFACYTRTYHVLRLRFCRLYLPVTRFFPGSYALVAFAVHTVYVVRLDTVPHGSRSVWLWFTATRYGSGCTHVRYRLVTTLRVRSTRLPHTRVRLPVTVYLIYAPRLQFCARVLRCRLPHCRITHHCLPYLCMPTHATWFTVLYTGYRGSHTYIHVLLPALFTTPLPPLYAVQFCY